MTNSWEALGARARGLSTHLLSEDRARAVERARTVADLWTSLRDTPYGRHMDAREVSPAALDVAVTRSLAQRVAQLARWAGPGGGALEALFVEQDARNVRDILRDLLGGAPADRRGAAALPTPLLGRRELEVLARSDSAGSVAAALVGWGHPLGPALLEEAAQRRPDPFRLETALARRAAGEATRAAKGGGSMMKAFVRDGIDARNAVTALVLAGERSESDPGDLFVQGGRALRLEDFERAASAPSRAAATELLGAATRGTGLSEALRGLTESPAALQERILELRIEDLARRGREQPVSALPVLLFVLRLRREAQLVRRALWRAALYGGA